MARWIVILTLALLAGWTQAKEAAPAAEDPVLEARMLRIATELRKEMLKRGDSDQMIIDYMTARYGDFVLYRPPLKGTTLVLWFGPGLLLIGGLFTLFLVLRRRSRLSPDQFEADPDEEPPAAPSETTRSTLTASRHD